MSNIEQALLFQIKALKLVVPEQEHRFHPTRKWRFDFAWPQHKIAVECEGGTHMNGRHNRGTGYEADCEKYNEALLLGWRVLRVTGGQVSRGQAIRWVQQALREAGMI